MKKFFIGCISILVIKHLMEIHKRTSQFGSVKLHCSGCSKSEEILICEGCKDKMCPKCLFEFIFKKLYQDIHNITLFIPGFNIVIPKNIQEYTLENISMALRNKKMPVLPPSMIEFENAMILFNDLGMPKKSKFGSIFAEFNKLQKEREEREREENRKEKGRRKK